jgi:hypothetical protein
MSKNMLRVLLAAAGLTLAGCTSGQLECALSCEHYDDCVGGTFDATQCADVCEDNADLSDAFEERVAVCNDCLDDFECSATCKEVCTGIIPAF